MTNVNYTLFVVLNRLKEQISSFLTYELHLS